MRLLTSSKEQFDNVVFDWDGLIARYPEQAARAKNDVIDSAVALLRVDGRIIPFQFQQTYCTVAWPDYDINDSSSVADAYVRAVYGISNIEQWMLLNTKCIMHKRPLNVNGVKVSCEHYWNTFVYQQGMYLSNGLWLTEKDIVGTTTIDVRR